MPHKERIHLRPREIQDRIRHGETVEQIIAATGMEERRVRPYAAPIDMERARIAELARDAYPVRSDGPADQPLREVLATAFVARGESLRASTWTAAMDNSDHWVVSVSWAKGNRPGGTRFIADFRYIPADQDPATAVPVNSVASDLIDPRFERPVRTVSPLIPASRQDSGEEPYGDDDPGAAAAEAAAAAGWGEPAPSQDDPGNNAGADTNTGAGGNAAADPAADDQANAPSTSSATAQTGPIMPRTVVPAARSRRSPRIGRTSCSACAPTRAPTAGTGRSSRWEPPPGSRRRPSPPCGSSPPPSPGTC